MKIVKNEPNPEVIDVLEKVLKKAKEGRILSVAVAYVDDSSMHLGSISFWTRPTDRLTLMGTLSFCANEVMKGLKLEAKT